MGFFLRHLGTSLRTSLSLWILGVYPVFSIMSLIGMYIPRSSFVCIFVANMSNLRRMTLAVYQLSLIRTILFFVALILWTDEKYDYGDVSFTNPNAYINAIVAISTWLSFYGYLLFYQAARPALPGSSAACRGASWRPWGLWAPSPASPRSRLTPAPRLSITTPWWWRCSSSASLPVTVSDGSSSRWRTPQTPRARPPRRSRP
nr:uncharacterized protein LOC106732534 isoform X2 [Pelodiscus sinensis]|eukprot:XP_025044329.1 uncharacterized protein LOC106732534 isoform X2 [Pelodiscus sinensis]